MTTPALAPVGRGAHADAPWMRALNARLTRAVLDGMGLAALPLRDYEPWTRERPVFAGLHMGLGDVFLMAPIVRQLAERHGGLDVLLAANLAGRRYVPGLLGTERVRFFGRSGDLVRAAKGPAVALTLKPVPARARRGYVAAFGFEDAAPVDLDLPCVTLWRRMLELDETASSVVRLTIAEDLRALAWRDLRRLGVRPQRGPLVAVQCGSAWAIKRYPDALLTDLVGRLAATAQVVLLGGAGEGGALRGPGVVDLRGRTTLEGSIALLSFADLLVAPDSVLIHAAAALGISTLAFFGPTAARHWAAHYPRCHAIELPDAVCDRKPCGLSVDVETMERALPPGCEHGAQCIAAVPPVFVAARAEKILEGRNARWHP
ncbi:MAG: hypothetical protein KC466_03115 [Myxococcales bacterium]|nr:hypothetical protein [Myxococcales bacterium]